MTFGRLQVQPGMQVVGTAGTPIGEVRETRDEDFLVSRPMARDVYVPYGAIRALMGNQIVLNVRADEIDVLGWPSPALAQPPGAPAGTMAAETEPGTIQRTEGEGRAPTHTHPARVHTHDHYHVTHHHAGGLLGEWEHRTSWHTHEHNHNELTHSHDYGLEDEEQQHGREAHIHDHAAPTRSPA